MQISATDGASGAQCLGQREVPAGPQRPGPGCQALMTARLGSAQPPQAGGAEAVGDGQDTRGPHLSLCPGFGVAGEG